MKALKISVLDDNMFFLKVFHHRIVHHTLQLELCSDFQIDVNAYSNFDLFLSKYEPSTDLLFLDFNLGYGFNALGIIDELKKGQNMPKIVIISEQSGLSKIDSTALGYVDRFIKKDMYIIPKSCLLIQDTINEKFNIA